jgi:DNA ligase-1
MAQFLQVSELAEEMAGTARRLKKRAAIAAAIAAVHAEGGGDEGVFCSYLAGLPFAESDPRKLNAGGALLTRAVLAVTGASQGEWNLAYRRHGDLGAAAFDLMGEKPRSENPDLGHPLSLRDVEEAFAGMASARTTAVRAGLVEGLLRRASPLEAKYLLKLMLGDMRIGVKQSLVEEAIAVAASSSGISTDVAAVRHAVMLEADLGDAARRAFAGTLAEARMRLFHPLGFMLASPVETPEEAIERFTAKPVKVVAEKKPKKRPDAVEGAMPPALIRGIESESGLSMEGVKVEYNSSEPANAEAVAHASGADLHIAPGQEEHLPREAWHVVQQKQGRIGTGAEESGSVVVNDDGSLEAEADAMGLAAATVVQAFLEDKYDGMRAQVHCGAAEHPGRVAIYSRNREDITESFPELVEAFAAVGDAAGGGLIFDGEILGWDHSVGQALPFAVLGQRIGRKKVDNEWRQRVPVVFMAFDLMFADGELQLGRALRDRRNRLEAAVEALVDKARSPLVFVEEKVQGGLFAPAPRPGGEALPRLMISPARLVESAEEIDRAYADARARANEGVMLKAAGSVYQPGRRGLAWVKLKRELATLDVVITGAEYGHGRRAGLLSDYTFAVRDAAGELLNVGKAYSGVTDAEIAELTEFLKAHTLEDQGHFRTVEPLVVLEVAFNNIMRSDRHASGFALRFPRILRIRTDKPLEEIDTVERVEEVYQSQVDKPAERE